LSVSVSGLCIKNRRIGSKRPSSQSQCRTQLLCMHSFIIAIIYSKIFSYPLSNFTFRYVSRTYPDPPRPGFFTSSASVKTPDPLMRSAARRRHNPKKTRLSPPVYNVFKIIMRTLACVAPLRAFSSYMTTVTRISLCSKLPTHFSSCMSILIFFTPYTHLSKPWGLPKARRGRTRGTQASSRRALSTPE